MGLTEDAKNEIRDAIRIVREDKFEAFVRSRTAPKDEPPKNDPPPKDEPPKNDGPNPPLPKDEPPKPDDTPQPRKSSYWGEILDD